MTDPYCLWTEPLREGEAWAKTCAKEGDSWGDLADMLGLEPSEVPLWVNNMGSDSLPTPGKDYEVPNVSVFFTQGWSRFLIAEQMVERYLRVFVESDREAGFKVVDHRLRDDTPLFRRDWKTEGLYKMNFGGHGYSRENSLGDFLRWDGVVTDTKTKTGSSPRVVAPLYKLKHITALHCGGSNVGWQKHLSKNGGSFIGLDDPTEDGTFALGFVRECKLEFHTSD